MRTSTTVDRERGRTMEADALIGVIVRKAESGRFRPGQRLRFMR